jgi:MFS family permease
VPEDRVRQANPGPKSAKPPLEPFRPSPQFMLAVLLYFCFFSLNTFRLVATPIALKQIALTDVTAAAGIAFTLGGIASALGVWLPESAWFNRWRLRTILATASIAGAAVHLLLAFSEVVWLYIAAFTIAAFLNAAMVPVTNSLIAFNVSRARRGTAFGISSGAQAVAFMAGPMAAALFATSSLKLGFGAASAMLVALAALIVVAVREPAQPQ